MSNKRTPCARCKQLHQKDNGKIRCHQKQLKDAQSLAAFGDLPESYRAEAATEVLAFASKLHASASRWLALSITREAKQLGEPVKPEIETPPSLPFEEKEEEEEEWEDPLDRLSRILREQQENGQ